MAWPRHRRREGRNAPAVGQGLAGCSSRKPRNSAWWQGGTQYAGRGGWHREKIRLAGPLVHALPNGRAVGIDEMNNSLHPALVQCLVDPFHDPARNTHGAQRVYATHNTSILRQDTFRRDQALVL